MNWEQAKLRVGSRIPLRFEPQQPQFVGALDHCLDTRFWIMFMTDGMDFSESVLKVYCEYLRYVSVFFDEPHKSHESLAMLRSGYRCEINLFKTSRHFNTKHRLQSVVCGSFLSGESSQETRAFVGWSSKEANGFIILWPMNHWLILVTYLVSENNSPDTSHSLDTYLV